MPSEPEDLTELQRLYDDGRYLDGRARLAAFSPPEMWRGLEARILAGRYLSNLGADRRSRNLHRETWKAHPTNSQACCFHAYGVNERHGPFEALRFIEEIHGAAPPAPDAGPETDSNVVHLWLQRARLLTTFRDFAASERWLAAALAAAPDDPWSLVELAYIREAQDRYDEALDAAGRALAVRPYYRPAVCARAHLLSLRERDDEAIALLQAALIQLQSGTVAHQLGAFLEEKERFAEAEEAYALTLRYYPDAEKATAEGFRLRRADVLYRMGRLEDAKRCAEGTTNHYFDTFARRLATVIEKGDFRARVTLPVGFVRQHHMTCAPATLSAISRFWQAPIDHLALANVITYDGTPDHEERAWMERNGWLVREFKVTWEAATALLDRGIPFTLVTTHARNAHLQAVIGYDPNIGTLVIRDPYRRQQSETLATEFLEQQAPYGPRGMVLVPAAAAGRLEGIGLPEQALYDHWYTLRRALQRHERPQAEAALQALEATASDHRLTWQARRELAYYDDNPLRVHEAVEALRRLYPKEPNLRLEELAVLGRLGRRPERLERLREFALSRGGEPVFWREYAEELRSDAREHGRAFRYARRLMRFAARDWPNLLTYAHVEWGARRFEQAVRIYRLAATLGEKAEGPWWAYFNASRLTRQTEVALQLLRERWTRLRATSASPTETLCRSLDQLERTVEAQDVLREGLAARPDDGELHLYAAEMHGRCGQFGKAAEHLAEARPRVSESSWAAIAAQLATWQARHADALARWRELLAANPLNTRGHAEVARLLAMTAGRPAALAWLAEQVNRFPHFLPLRSLRLEWLRSESTEQQLAEIEEYLRLEPRDAWALREKALALLRLRRFEEALTTARSAEEIEPRAPASPGIVGQILLDMRRFAEAREATQRGLRLSIDADWLMPQLLRACPEFSDRVAAVGFLRDELGSQASLGQGFLNFYDAAVGVLPPPELQAALGQLRQAQPEHWEVWSASILEALARNDGETALRLAQEATARFPLLARLSVDAAAVHRFRGADADEMAALHRALELAPGWQWPSSRLAALHLRLLQPEKAEETLRKALQYNPLDARLTAEHARVLWMLGRREEALAGVERSISLAPDFGFPWSLLTDFTRIIGETERGLALARRLTKERAGEAEPHWRVAQELSERGQTQEALAALDAALAVDPLHHASHDQRAVMLASLGRYDEALTACRPAAFGDSVPVELDGRAAWVEWVRGNRKGAIDRMQAAVAKHPDFSWGHQLLSDWLDQLGRLKEALAAAERYAALNPASPVPLGFIADILIKQGNKTLAADYLRRALRVDPSYLYASEMLLSEAIEKEAWKEAETMVGLVENHGSPWLALRWRVQYHGARRERAAARAALEQLGRTPERETVSLCNAANDFLSRGPAAELAATIESCWGQDGTNPEMGALWMRARLQNTAWPRLSTVLNANVSEAIKERALRAYVESLAEKRRSIRFLWTLWRHRARIRASDSLWGHSGYGFARMGMKRRAVRWMRDWESRREPQPWMLYNLALCLFDLGRDQQGIRVVERALALAADHVRPHFIAWSAFHAALAGRLEQAAELLAAFDAPGEATDALATADCARALVEVDQASGADRRAKMQAWAARIRGTPHYNVPHVKRSQRRAVIRLADLAGNAWHRLCYRLPRLDQ